MTQHDFSDARDETVDASIDRDRSGVGPDGRVNIRKLLSGGTRATIVSGLALACLAWAAEDRVYLADLIAQFTTHSAAAAAVFAAWWFVRRHWVAATFTASLAAVAIGMGVLPDRSLTAASGAVGATGGPVRILLYNALADNPNEAGVRSVIFDAGADLVGLLEAPQWLIDELREGGDWRERYPHYFVSDRAGAGFKVVLSRWPQHAADGRFGSQRAAVDGMRRPLIDRPEGVFAFTLFHPRSPRTPTRWREGNAHVRTLIAAHRETIAPLGVAHVAAADVNATPTGWRSRAIADAGLRRTKPLLAPTGTIPAGVPWPLSIAIDGVVASDGVLVRSWDAIDGAGSDHKAVLVDLWVPAPTGEVSLQRPAP